MAHDEPHPPPALLRGYAKQVTPKLETMDQRVLLHPLPALLSHVKPCQACFATLSLWCALLVQDLTAVPCRHSAAMARGLTAFCSAHAQQELSSDKPTFPFTSVCCKEIS